MNYNDLFKETNVLGDADFCCKRYRTGGEFELQCNCPYPMLFILHGRVELTFLSKNVAMGAGNLIVLDAAHLTKAVCDDDTIMIVYTPPRRLTHYLGHCKEVFGKPCSSIVPFMDAMYEWVDNLLATYCRKDCVITEELNKTQRRALAKVMTGYPQHVLGELYVPFYACTLGNCDTCTGTTM